MKLSKLSIGLLIIQTIITLGFNWVFFIITYLYDKIILTRFSKNQDFILPKKVIFMSVLSVAFGLLYSYVFVNSIKNYQIHNIYRILNLKSFVFTKTSSLLYIFNVYLFLSLIYLNLVNQVFFHLYKSKFDYSERKERLFIWFSIITFGLFIIYYYLFYIIYDIYNYVLSKYILKKSYQLSNRSKVFISLFLSLYLFAILKLLLSSYNIIIVLIMLVFLLMPILNFGLYEFRMRLFLSNNLDLLQKKEDVQPIKNVKIVYLLVMVVTLLLVISNIISWKDTSLHKINTKNLSCNVVEDNEICIEEFDHNTIFHEKNKSQLQLQYGYEQKDVYQYFSNSLYTNHFPETIQEGVKYHKYSKEKIYPSTIKTDEIKSSDDYYYLTVQTYYKKINADTYVPYFNIIKKITVRFTNDYPSVSIIDNAVYIYYFSENSLSKYNQDYLNIDVSRLVLDIKNINIKTKEEVLRGVGVENRGDSISLNPYKNTTIFLIASLFDPVHLNKIFTINYMLSNHTKLEQTQMANIFDVIEYELTGKSDLSYPKDEYYLTNKIYKNNFSYKNYTDYFGNVLLVPYNETTVYVNNKKGIEECVLTIESPLINQCLQGPNRENTDTMNLDRLKESERIAFVSGENLHFMIFDSNVDYKFTIKFEIKSIKQYINKEDPLFKETVFYQHKQEVN